MEPSRLSSISDGVMEEDVLSRGGRFLSLDDASLYVTPAPVAASTQARGNRAERCFDDLSFVCHTMCKLSNCDCFAGA